MRRIKTDANQTTLLQKMSRNYDNMRRLQDHNYTPKAYKPTKLPLDIKQTHFTTRQSAFNDLLGLIKRQETVKRPSKIMAFEKENIRRNIRINVTAFQSERTSTSKRNISHEIESRRLTTKRKTNHLRLTRYQTEFQQSTHSHYAPRIDTFSIKGTKGSENQDSFCVSDNVYVLCDGHGQNGKNVSEFVAINLHKLLEEQLKRQSISESILKELASKIDSMLDLTEIDTEMSGCTCVAIVKSKQSLWVLSLGDSRAIVTNGFETSTLTSEHKPSDPEEKNRIVACGGVVRRIQTSRNSFSGPERIWGTGKGNWGPGIAVSRAFGDKMARRYGLISEPTVKHYPIDSKMSWIVIGSDGIFDVMSNSEVARMSQQLFESRSTTQSVAKELCEQSRQRWGTISDDISCVVIRL